MSAEGIEAWLIEHETHTLHYARLNGGGTELRCRSCDEHNDDSPLNHVWMFAPLGVPTGHTSEDETDFDVGGPLFPDYERQAAPLGVPVGVESEPLIGHLTKWIMQSGWVGDYEHARAESESFVRDLPVRGEMK